MEEQLDIYTDKYEYIGTAGKKEVHIKGMWHRVITCLVINPEKKTVFLQKKMPGKYSFDRPDYLDFSAGGHYQAGEGIGAGVREIKEEIGIDAKFEELIPVGVRQTAATITPYYIANEFQHLFLLPIRKELRDFAFEDGEVTGLVEFSIEDGIQLLLGKVDSVQAEGVFTVEGKVQIQKLKLTRSDFVPAYLEIDQIFLRFFIAAKRYIQGDNPEEIFC